MGDEASKLTSLNGQYSLNLLKQSNSIELYIKNENTDTSHNTIYHETRTDSSSDGYEAVLSTNGNLKINRLNASSVVQEELFLLDLAGDSSQVSSNYLTIQDNGIAEIHSGAFGNTNLLWASNQELHELTLTYDMSYDVNTHLRWQ